MSKQGEILVIDDNEAVLKAAKAFLKRHFRQVDTLSKPEAALTLMAENAYDIILLDMNFTRDLSSGKEGFHWLSKILEADPAAVVILITAYGDVEMAVKAIKAGATDFVLKPWDNAKLLATLSASLRLRKSKQEAQQLRQQNSHLQEEINRGFADLIGSSPAMEEVFSTIQQVAPTDANILVLGENGTGKELVARALHAHSLRSEKPFVKVDLGAIPVSLFESELFGHVKGAFTDAREDKAGRLELASGGTLFLDEIGNLSPELQVKLLTVLQSRELYRVGSNRPVPIDIRLVCATNQDLGAMIRAKSFREDLYYRINTIQLYLPPLRERGNDILLLAEHFAREYGEKYQKQAKDISPTARARLLSYPWPGNVRELQHSVERAVIMSRTDQLGVGDFFLKSAKRESPQSPAEMHDLPLDELEKLVIRKALKKHGGNVTRAAAELGLTRSSLYRRMEKYDL